MAPLQLGVKSPDDTVFERVPIEGTPQGYDASTAWRGRKIVLMSVPGTSMPLYQAVNLPPHVGEQLKLKEKGVDVVAMVASHEAWAMSARGKVNDVNPNDVKPNDEIFLLMADPELGMSNHHGWAAGMGDRSRRWAMVLEKGGTIKSAENNLKGPSKVTFSGVKDGLKAS